MCMSKLSIVYREVARQGDEQAVSAHFALHLIPRFCSAMYVYSNTQGVT